MGPGQRRVCPRLARSASTFDCSCDGPMARSTHARRRQVVTTASRPDPPRSTHPVRTHLHVRRSAAARPVAPLRAAAFAGPGRASRLRRPPPRPLHGLPVTVADRDSSFGSLSSTRRGATGPDSRVSSSPGTGAVSGAGRKRLVPSGGRRQLGGALVDRLGLRCVGDASSRANSVTSSSPLAVRPCKASS